MRKSVTKNFLIKCLRNRVGTNEIELTAKRLNSNKVDTSKEVRNVKDVVLVLKRRVTDATKKEKEANNEYVKSKVELNKKP